HAAPARVRRLEARVRGRQERALRARQRCEDAARRSLLPHRDVRDVTAVVPSRRTRYLLALTLGLLAAAEVWVKTGHPGGASDFDQVWYGATVLREGGNPYRAIGPEARIYWGWPLYYPLPAMLAVTPLAMIPVHAARSLFAGASVAVLVQAIT